MRFMSDAVVDIEDTIALFDCRESRSLIASAYVRCSAILAVVENRSLRMGQVLAMKETWRMVEGRRRKLAIGALLSVCGEWMCWR